MDAAALLAMLKLREGNVFSKSEQDRWTFILDTTATATVVARAIPVFILAHPVFELLGLALLCKVKLSLKEQKLVQ